MLRASSETAVATLTAVNLERPMRTASDHASRRAEAMSFSWSTAKTLWIALLAGAAPAGAAPDPGFSLDRKSTRLNSSHSQISYAVFCLKKKKKNKKQTYS